MPPLSELVDFETLEKQLGLQLPTLDFSSENAENAENAEVALAEMAET